MFLNFLCLTFLKISYTFNLRQKIKYKKTIKFKRLDVKCNGFFIHLIEKIKDYKQAIMTQKCVDKNTGKIKIKNKTKVY